MQVVLVSAGVSSLFDRYNSASHCIDCSSIQELQFDWTCGWSGKPAFISLDTFYIALYIKWGIGNLLLVIVFPYRLALFGKCRGEVSHLPAHFRERSVAQHQQKYFVVSLQTDR